MEYSKKFLKEFKVNTGQTYIVVPVDGKLHEVPLSRKNTNKKYFAMVRAEESPIREFQCSAIECDFKYLDECIGCRCLPGGRKDNKAVVFKIEYIYQNHDSFYFNFIRIRNISCSRSNNMVCISNIHK